MEKYLMMSDVFKSELFIDSDCDDVIVDGLSLTVLESFSGSDAAKFALHAINSHDELVEMNKELLAIIERVIGSSKEFDKVMGTSEWADGYKQCAIDTGEALRGIIDNIKAKATS